jgi:hypothetical protein
LNFPNKILCHKACIITIIFHINKITILINLWRINTFKFIHINVTLLLIILTKINWLNLTRDSEP